MPPARIGRMPLSGRRGFGGSLHDLADALAGDAELPADLGVRDALINELEDLLQPEVGCLLHRQDRIHLLHDGQYKASRAACQAVCQGKKSAPGRALDRWPVLWDNASAQGGAL